jgi:hypothetical protein
MTITEIIIYTIVLIIIATGIYYIYPQSVYYIPEVKRLYNITKDIDKWIEKNNELTASLAQKTVELEAKMKELNVSNSEIENKKKEVEIIQKGLESCNINLAKMNADLVNAVNDLEESKAKYSRLGASVIRFIDEDLSDAHMMIIKTAQILVDHHANFSPDSKKAFKNLYLSILDLGIIGAKDICKYKGQIMSFLDTYINMISNRDEDRRLCDIFIIKQSIDYIKNQLLYWSVSYPATSTRINPPGTVILKTVDGQVYALLPKIPEETLIAANKVVDNIVAYISTILAYFCENGKLNMDKVKLELKHHISVLKCS